MCRYERKAAFSLSSIHYDDKIVTFYTGFGTFSALMVCFNFLGPAVDKLNYWLSKSIEENKSNKGMKMTLYSLQEFFVLVCLCLAYHLGVSQSTVSQIHLTWISFLYFRLKQIPLWPPKPLTVSSMPKAFKDTSKYSCTSMIINTTEIYIEQPVLVELQRLTFSMYKSKYIQRLDRHISIGSNCVCV